MSSTTSCTPSASLVRAKTTMATAMTLMAIVCTRALTDPCRSPSSTTNVSASAIVASATVANAGGSGSGRGGRDRLRSGRHEAALCRPEPADTWPWYRIGDTSECPGAGGHIGWVGEVGCGMYGSGEAVDGV